MFHNTINKQQKNLKEKEVKKKMSKSLLSIFLALLVGMSGLPPVQADQTATPGIPYRKSYTFIDYTSDNIGRLLSQILYSTTNGIRLGGTSYTTTEKVTYAILNGKAYASTRNTVETSKHADGTELTITTDITYNRDKNGVLLSATGTRTTNGFEAASIDADTNGDGKITTLDLDHNKNDQVEPQDLVTLGVTDRNGDNVVDTRDLDTNRDGQLSEDEIAFPIKDRNNDGDIDPKDVDFDNDGKIDKKFLDERNYFERVETLTFEIINGEAEISTAITTKFDTFDKKDGSKISQLKAGKPYVTYYNYQVKNGVTKLVDVFTDGWIESLGQGTSSDGSHPYEHITGRTHNAYDNAGNLLVSGITHGNGPDGKTGTADDEFFAPDKNKIIDQDGNGSVLNEVVVAAAGGSFSFETRSGIRMGEGWVNFTENRFTAFEVKNGVLDEDWTYIDYSNGPLDINAPPSVGVDPIIEGTVVDAIKVSSDENNAGQINKAVWLYIKDGAGVMWAVLYYTNEVGGKSFRDLGDWVGKKIKVSGDLFNKTFNLINPIPQQPSNHFMIKANSDAQIMP